MLPTKEEQKTFAEENARLVVEMKEILDFGQTEENIVALNDNIEKQRRLWNDYTRKHKGEETQ
jgi:hypothetical protein